MYFVKILTADNTAWVKCGCGWTGPFSRVANFVRAWYGPLGLTTRYAETAPGVHPVPVCPRCNAFAFAWRGDARSALYAVPAPTVRNALP